MKYSEVIAKAAEVGINIDVRVVPIGLSSYSDFVESCRIIDWSAVQSQTDINFSPDHLVKLNAMQEGGSEGTAENIMWHLRDWGYLGVLLCVVVDKSTYSSDTGYLNKWAQSDGYAYLPDPDWSEIGVKLGELVAEMVSGLSTFLEPEIQHAISY